MKANFERITTNKQRRGYDCEMDNAERKRKQRQKSKRNAQKINELAKTKLYNVEG